MKKILIAISLMFFCSGISAQLYYGPYEIYYGRQPSAKAEAMGRGMVANPSNEFASYYNPASSSFTKGIDLNLSFSHKYYSDSKADFNYEGVSYDLKRGRGNIGISRYYMGSGRERNNDNINFTLYTLNYSRHIIDGFYGGINLNFINSHIHGRSSYPSNRDPENVVSASIDIGAIKTFYLNGKNFTSTTQMITFGTSITNATFTVLQSYFGMQNLPVLLRAGGAYKIDFYNFKVTDNERKPPDFTRFLEFLITAEVEKELRHDNLDIYRAGAEATIYEILSLRGGAYSNWYTGGHKNTYFTYGVGVNIPLNKLTDGDYPFRVMIDYANMKQPSSRNFGNFSVISVKINWIPE